MNKRNNSTEKRNENAESMAWCIVTALENIVEKSRESKLNETFWTSCKEPLEYLESVLHLTKMQIVFLSIMIEEGNHASWKDFCKFLDCGRISLMRHFEDLENLALIGWIWRKNGNRGDSWVLEDGVMDALRQNKAFEPKKINGLCIQEFVDCLEERFNRFFEDRDSVIEFEEEWMARFCKANSQLPLCQELLKLNDTHALFFVLWVVYDYTQFADSSNEGLTFRSIELMYPRERAYTEMKRKLRNGTHPLIQAGVIEQKCEEGIAVDRLVLTTKAKEDFLSGCIPSQSECLPTNIPSHFMKNHASIAPKQMFYNDIDNEQIDRLISLLDKENFPAVQKRLTESGMRKGFACLFYGAPGTGKTETVLQIARKTGRDIMRVDIAGMRDKYVGESEKNIKAVFERYRAACKQNDVLPILFFNEADALINKRLESISNSVDKMENSIQNIVLQEIEELDGILIATTNLTSNLDNAFERRFLYKVEFHKPNADVKSKLWESLLKDLTKEQTTQLASLYDFSGGQIENIARKYTVDYILNGQKPSMEDIDKYCQMEMLNQSTRKKLGFKTNPC